MIDLAQLIGVGPDQPFEFQDQLIRREATIVIFIILSKVTEGGFYPLIGHDLVETIPHLLHQTGLSGKGLEAVGQALAQLHGPGQRISRDVVKVGPLIVDKVEEGPQGKGLAGPFVVSLELGQDVQGDVSPGLLVALLITVPIAGWRCEPPRCERQRR